MARKVCITVIILSDKFGCLGLAVFIFTVCVSVSFQNQYICYVFLFKSVFRSLCILCFSVFGRESSIFEVLNVD